MNSKKRGIKVSCPQCGTEFANGKKELTSVATGIDRNAPIKSNKTAQERIDALRNAGVNVSNLFAMKGANGGEYIASNKDGMLSILDDNDPIFSQIINQGTVPNNRLFRRWVMSQMFQMMSCTHHRSKEPVGVTEMIHRFGYEYQWKMLMDELYAQMKMEGKDSANFSDRNRWFNADVVVAMANDYIAELKKRVDHLKEKKCKGIPYKRICGRNIFVADLHNKLFGPLYVCIPRIAHAKNATQLYNFAKKFNELRIKMTSSTPQSKRWVDAYKGSGAYFTMQNLVRFHNCIAIDDAGKYLDKYQSIAFISQKAEMYKDGEGWRLLAVLKKMLADNNIDIKKKMAEWRKKK